MDAHTPVRTSPATQEGPTFAWWLVLCLVGLDYFSSLAYLPTVALVANGSGDLAPLAALGVVLITLLVALPVYLYVVGRSPHGRGAVGLLETLVHGWRGKVLVLVLLGFVATDFVITRSLSSADAARHVAHNPYWQEQARKVTSQAEALRPALPGPLRGGFFDFWTEDLVITLVLTVVGFALYAFVVRGYSRGFLWLCAGVVVLYLGLTAVVVGSGLAYLAGHPGRFEAWHQAVLHSAGTRVGAVELAGWLAVAAVISFPQLALGLSGFELSMTTSRLVRGQPGDDPDRPRGRIRNARKLLVAAAVVMSVFMLGSVLVVTLLVPREVATTGAARFRALAYLAHGGPLAAGVGEALGPWFGPAFGTLYDFAAVLILSLAGASVTIGLRDLVPTSLARFGMHLEWARKVGLTLHLFNVVILVLTLFFQASVSAQQWAYATSVLVLLLGAGLAATLDLARAGRPVRIVGPFALATALFLLLAVLTVARNRTGLAIALGFVAVVLVTGFLSRWLRSTDLRFEGFTFADDGSQQRWEKVRALPFQVLVPHRPGRHSRTEKEQAIRRRHRLGPEVPVVFIESELGDPSDFYHRPLMRIVEEDGLEVIRVSKCASVAHVVAAIALEFRVVGEPPEIHFGWSQETPVSANFHFLLFGEGNVPWMVYELIRRAEPDPQRRPHVIVG